MKQFPTSIKFNRPHKIKVIKGTKGVNLSRFTCGLRLKQAVYLTYPQLEAARRAISRLTKSKRIKNKKNLKLIHSARRKHRRSPTKRARARRRDFLLFRTNLCLPLTKKPLQVRMGKGKGHVDRWVYAANRSRVLIELSRRRLKFRKIYRLFRVSSIKLPVKTKITYYRSNSRRERIFHTNAIHKLIVTHEK